VPGGLHASAAPGSIELNWERNTEPDLNGYRIYRATGAGEFEKLADVSVAPSYSDRAVEAGKTYRYAVASLDRTGNESARSAVAEVLVP
jgi:fibronectin type 3 domain-containing protein